MAVNSATRITERSGIGAVVHSSPDVLVPFEKRPLITDFVLDMNNLE
jgi:hypothetical protein